MFTDGAHKRKGKFLKKDSPLMEKVKVQRFNFSEIRKSKVLYPDNPSYNIYYKNLQQPEHLESTVSLSGKIFEDLQGKGMKAPVIFPRDFTADWIEEKKKMKRRSAHKNFDDDEFEMAIEEEERKAREEESLVIEYRERVSKKKDPESVKKPQETANPDDPKPNEETVQSSESESESESNTEENLKSLQSGHAETTSMEDMGEAIRNFSHSGVESNPLKTVKEESDSDGSNKDEFIPTPITEEEASAKPENEPDYNLDQEQEKHDIFEQAHQSGYEEGLRKGKEDAIQATQQETQSMIDSFHKSLENLKDLNRKILEKAQDNFTEISSALSEALIGKAIKIDPSLFKNIIDKAIADGISDQEYRIRVSPKLLGELKNLGIADIDDRWQEDPSIEEGQFIVESDETKISNNLKDIIDTMLNKLDINLFEESPTQKEKKQDEE